MTMYEFGVEFEDAYECTHPKIDRILNAFGRPHRADCIFQNEQIEIYRFLTQTGTGSVFSFNIMYSANLKGTQKYIVCCGSIQSCRPDKIPEYEAVGKRKLYNAIRSTWKIRF